MGTMPVLNIPTAQTLQVFQRQKLKEMQHVQTLIPENRSAVPNPQEERQLHLQQGLQHLPLPQHPVGVEQDHVPTNQSSRISVHAIQPPTLAQQDLIA